MNTIHYKGHTINIEYNSHPESPRDWCNLGTFYSNWGEGNYDDIDQGNLEMTEDWLQKNDYIYHVVYGYEHSGRAISLKPFGCRWDSGISGIIAVHKDKIRQEYNVKRISNKCRRQVLDSLENEVETYDKYLRGEVYGYSIDGPLSEDSCWGFYDLDYCEQYAKDVIDYQVKQSMTEHFNRLKMWITSKVPLIYRKPNLLIY